MAKKILVIDDDVLVMKTVSRYLKTCGYEVTAVTSGEEAIKQSASSAYDLIIADMRMPGMNGIETIKKIREICQKQGKTKIPEIIITGYASDEAQEEAKAAGISEYIYKPFEIAVFIDAVKRSLGE
ncbi:MAG: response regulator [Candidatus Omnitrophota bacterium]